MRKYFVTGLVLLLPLALTAIIVLFLFNLLTEPFVGVASSILRRYGWFSDGFLFMSAEEAVLVISRILILLLLFFTTVLLGMLARVVFMHYIIRVWEYVVSRIPLVRSIYKTSQDVIRTIFTSDTSSFKQVVMVSFPNSDTHSLGLVTREHLEGLPPQLGEKRVAVFVPTTPNPTSGFLMLFEPEDIIYLDMTVEEALKYVISCGVIATPFKNSVREGSDI